MKREELQQEIKDSLKNYFGEKDLYIDSIVDSFSSLIFKYADCDYEKVLMALEDICLVPKENLEEENHQHVYDVSRDGGSKMELKTFYHKGLPVLYFCKNGEATSFFKFKKERKNGNLIFRAKYKSDELEQSNAETFTESYTFIDSGVFYSSSQNKFAVAPTRDKVVSVKEFSTEQREFLETIKTCLAGNGVKFSGRLSREGAKLLFGDVYKKTKQTTGFDEELQLNEVLRILLETVYDNSRLSQASVRIGQSGGNPFEFLSNRGEPLKVSVSRSGEHLSMETMNSEDKKTAVYMIFKTNEGFTIYRNYMGTMQNFEKDLSTITINLSEDTLRVSVHGNGGIIHPIEFITKFNADGKIEFSCNENIFIPSGMTSGKQEQYAEKHS